MFEEFPSGFSISFVDLWGHREPAGSRYADKEYSQSSGKPIAGHSIRGIKCFYCSYPDLFLIILTPQPSALQPYRYVPKDRTANEIDRIALEMLPPGSVFADIFRFEDPVPLKAATKSGVAEMWDAGPEGTETIVQGQQSVAPESDNDGINSHGLNR